MAQYTKENKVELVNGQVIGERLCSRTGVLRNRVGIGRWIRVRDTLLTYL